MQKENGRLVGYLVVAILAISTGLTIYTAEMNAIESAKELNYTEFGENLVTLVLIIIVFSFSTIGIKLIFGNKNTNHGW